MAETLIDKATCKMKKIQDGSYRAEVKITEEEFDFLQRKWNDFTLVSPDDFLQFIVSGAIGKWRKAYGEGPPEAKNLLDGPDDNKPLNETHIIH